MNWNENWNIKDILIQFFFLIEIEIEKNKWHID